MYVSLFQQCQTRTIFYLFQRIMNFTFVVMEPNDGSFGALKSDGNWTGMIGHLINQKADIG